MNDTIRAVVVKTATIAQNGNLSGEVDMGGYTSGIVFMPAAWTAASIGFKASSTPSGTYAILCDASGSLAQIDSPAASKAYALPSAVGGASYIKLWSQDGSGSDTAQAAARTLTLHLKS